MTNDEISHMSFKEFEQYESERMSKNAWIVANELVKRIDGAPVHVLSECIDCNLAEKPNEMFLFNTANPHVR